MSDAKPVDLQAIRQARELRTALDLLDEAARQDGIEPDSYLGRYHAAVHHLMSRLVTTLDDFGQRTLETLEESRQTAEKFQAVTRDELAKLDRAARKSEAEFKRREIEIENNARALIERLSTELLAGLKDGNIIRAKTIDRESRVKTRILDAALTLGLVVVGVVIGHMFL